MTDGPWTLSATGGSVIGLAQDEGESFHDGRLGTGVTLEIVGPRHSRGGGLGTVRVEAGAVAEHGAGDVEQAVGHRAQSPGVAVAAGT